MGKNSKIEWLARPGTVPATWNPIRARNIETGKLGWFCEHATDGCLKCYAERWNLARGNGLDFLPSNRDKVEIFLDPKMATQPLRWEKPHTIFPCSMTDLFGDFVTDDMLLRMFAVMAATPHHTYIITTKRARRMREWLTASDTPGRVRSMLVKMAEELNNRDGRSARQHLLDQWGAVSNVRFPLPNVWLGVSVCDGGKYDFAYLNDLTATPAARRWISYEPALAFFDLDQWIGRVDWVVFGGESGSTRECQLWWARSTRELCQMAGVKFFVKQLGRRPVDVGNVPLHFKHTKGADMAEWPADLRIREFPEA